MPDFQWLTTRPNPYSPAHTCTEDAGQVGWRLHAVPGSSTETLHDFRGRRALCGLVAKHGWALDLFIEDNQQCQKCIRALSKIARKESA